MELDINESAAKISSIIKNTSVDDRHRLYMQIASELRLHTQNYQAGLFEAISYADRNSSIINVPK